MKEIKDRLEKYIKMLPMGTSVSFTEAEKRAGSFLEAMAFVTEMRHLLSQEKIKSLSLQTAVYAQELSKGTGKTMTENKISAEASKDYTSAREDLEGLDNDLSYLKAHFDIFMAGHVFWRNVAKGEQL